MLDHTAHYDGIETGIRRILDDKYGDFTQPERWAVVEFLSANEYGLAFEALVAALTGHPDLLDRPTALRALRMAVDMGYTESDEVRRVLKSYEVRV